MMEGAESNRQNIDQNAEKGLTAIIVFSLAFCFLIMMVAKNTSNPELSYWLITMPIWIVPALVFVCFIVWMFVDGMKALIQALSGG